MSELAKITDEERAEANNIAAMERAIQATLADLLMARANSEEDLRRWWRRIREKYNLPKVGLRLTADGEIQMSDPPAS